MLAKVCGEGVFVVKALFGWRVPVAVTPDTGGCRWASGALLSSADCNIVRCFFVISLFVQQVVTILMTVNENEKEWWAI